MQSTSDDAINGGTQIATPNANSTYSAEPNHFRTAGKPSHPHHGEDGAGVGERKITAMVCGKTAGLLLWTWRSNSVVASLEFLATGSILVPEYVRSIIHVLVIARHYMKFGNAEPMRLMCALGHKRTNHPGPKNRLCPLWSKSRQNLDALGGRTE